MPQPSAGLPLRHPHPPAKQGFQGCTVYDCFGAGQKVSQVTFGGQDWRRAPESARQMFKVFPVVRDLHELLWYVTEALTLEAARSLHGELNRAQEETDRLTRQSPDVLLELDVDGHRQGINDLLLRASEFARAEVGHKKELRGADLIGADLQGTDLRGASLRGIPYRSRPASCRSEDGRRDRRRLERRRLEGCRPDREHLPHPVPARRGQG